MAETLTDKTLVGRPETIDDLEKGIKYELVLPMACGKPVHDIRTFSGIINGKREFIKLGNIRGYPLAIEGFQVGNACVDEVKPGFKVVCCQNIDVVVYNVDDLSSMEADSEYQKRFLMLRENRELRY